jgi:hypothetical protein
MFRQRAVRTPSNRALTTSTASLSATAPDVRAMLQRRDAAHVAATVGATAATQPATGRRRRPGHGPPSRAGHHGCGLSREVTTKSVRSVPRAAKLQLSQRHVTAAGQHDRPQIGVGLVAAGVAEHQHADVAGAQRGSRGGQFVVVVGHRASIDSARVICLLRRVPVAGYRPRTWRDC